MPIISESLPSSLYDRLHRRKAAALFLREIRAKENRGLSTGCAGDQHRGLSTFWIKVSSLWLCIMCFRFTNHTSVPEINLHNLFE